MPNELAIISPSIKVNPSPITIENQEAFEKAIQAVVDKYGQDFVVTADNLSDTRTMRAQINKLYKFIEDRRKSAKREYDAPTKTFDAQMKNYASQIKGIMDPLDDKIHEADEQEKAERKEAVERLIADMAKAHGVSASDMPIRPSWLLKSATGKKVTEEIAADMDQFKKDRDQRAADIQTIKLIADSKDLEPSGWLSQLGSKNLTDILTEIDQAAQQRDADAKAEAELAEKSREAAKAVAESHQTKQDGETIDTDTGEVVPQTITVRLTGTHKALGQVWAGAKQLGVKVELIDKED